MGKYDWTTATAVVEAKAEYAHPDKGLQQAVQYTEMLNLKFAYSTNGNGNGNGKDLRCVSNRLAVVEVKAQEADIVSG